MSRRVAFVVYDYALGVSLMAVNSMRLLARDGVDVDVFVNSRSVRESPVSFEEPRIRMLVYDDDRAPWSRIQRRIGRRLRRITRASSELEPELQRFSRWLEAHLDASGYDLICAIELKALLALRFVAGGEKLAYYNIELFEGVVGHPLYPGEDVALLKRLEREMLARTAHLVLPSAARARIFCDINQLPEHRTRILPIASLGPATTERSTFFRTRFAIGAQETIVLYAGNIDEWSRIGDVIRSVRTWPPGFTLVIHTWHASRLKSAYGRRLLRDAQGWPIHFSTEYLDDHTLGRALSSADVGLMFYEPIDANFTEIMFSSNKLSEYVRNGLPVICSDFPSLAQFVTRYDVGVPIHSMDMMPAALLSCVTRLGELRRNTIRCYEECFRFEPHFAALRTAWGI